MKSINKLINLLNHILIQLSKNTKIILYKINKYISFTLNKRETLRKIYEPIITSKEKKISDLLLNIQEIKSQTLSIEKDIRKLNTYVDDLKKNLEHIEKDLIN
ncbi:hypothetical protein [Clostridium sp.]|uniref:hypothetical protein n=1 Tax=Clostridium sp. TaxID=1506 RepID=UPI002FCA1319